MTQSLPHTAGSLAGGDTVLVHSSLRAVGFMAGGVQAVVQALLDVLGPAGTLVVPTHTPANSDPAEWSNPPVPAPWWPVIRAQSPGFDPARTPSQWMGVLPETVRTWPAARRGSHPHVSFAAVGPRAAAITGAHPLEDGLGDGSPLGAIYRAHGKVLLLGCGHDSNTSLHLAECRQDHPDLETSGAAVREPGGGSSWVTWVSPRADASDFAELGAAYEKEGAVRTGKIGGADSRLMPQRDLVDFATGWLRDHRP